MGNINNNVSAVFLLLEDKVGGRNFVPELWGFSGGCGGERIGSCVFIFRGVLLELPFIQFYMWK